MERQASSFVICRYSPQRRCQINAAGGNPEGKVKMRTFSRARLSISTLGMGLERVNFDGEIFQRFGNGHRIGRRSFQTLERFG
jgi:hypothetical protein